MSTHDDREINPKLRYKNCKYICNQHKPTSKHKAKINKHKWNDSSTMKVGYFNTHLHQWTDNSYKNNKETLAFNDTLDP